MSKVFTKADIEIEHFEESVSYHDDQKVSKLYERLEELKSQGIYVVDVTLVSTHTAISSLSKVFNQYMIRFVRPKYSVKVSISVYDYVTRENEFSESKIVGYFDSEDEAFEVQQSYIKDSNADVQYEAEIQYHSLLDEEI